ncbi:hypothetical protein JTB14_012345 [Gonioctena quinquepunctata]|nr:hypothetical protein JTB14_012345 [Gonioctena quinquepunctata]
MQFLKNCRSASRLVKMSRKINYPAADRNKTPILGVLEKHLDKNIDGKVLEISSGTGQHLAHFAPNFPRLTFQPSEYEASLFDSIRSHAFDTPTKNIKEPLLINVVDDSSRWNVPRDFDYVININMIHVTPFHCTTGLFKNVGQILRPHGLLITYGPYANDGVLEPQSNMDFDKSIRQKDPTCGIRDIQELIKVADDAGIKLMYIYDLPANNKCLVWQKIQQ